MHQIVVDYYPYLNILIAVLTIPGQSYLTGSWATLPLYWPSRLVAGKSIVH